MLFIRKLDEFFGNLFDRGAYRLGPMFLMGIIVSALGGCGASSRIEQSGSISETGRVKAALLYRFVPGERLTYKLDYTSESTADFRSLFSSQKPSGAKTEAPPPGLAYSFKTAVQGELTATVLSNNGNTATISYSLRKPEVRLIVNEQVAVAEAEKIKTDLGRDIFAAVNLQGSVLGVRFEPGVGELSQSYVRALLAITQFVNPQAQASDLRQWETQEADPSGEYVARYEAMADSRQRAQDDSAAGLKSFSKIKTRYLQPRRETASDEVEAATEINPKGSLVARFDFPQEFLISLNGTESQTILVEGKAVATARNSVQMEELRHETLSADELASMRDANTERERIAVAVPLFAARSEQADEASIERTELGDLTLEGLLSDLTRMETSTNQTNDTPLYLKFKAMIYLHPESSASLGKILATADAKGAAMRILTGALGVVGHAEAQSALATAIRARAENWPALSLLIPALGQSPTPTQATEDLLRDLASNSRNQDIASTAQLSLGSMARKLAQTDPERAAKIVQVFVKTIESSPSTHMTRQIILALGNTGSTAALPVISRFINDPSPALRAAASEALRWVDSEQADSLLVNRLTSDGDTTVRLEAALALGFRKIVDSTLKAQESLFLKEREVKVRLAVLSNLWKARDAFPEVRRMVKAAAKHDASRDVRKAAAEIISRNTEARSDK